MAKSMLVDASHPDETRVAILQGNRLEDYDTESKTRKLLKGNIYLAKVIRVEPSLQAAFVEYGGNRHGFLAFSEIHPDYYRIPVEDREALLAELAAEAAAEEEEIDRAAAEGKDESGSADGKEGQGDNGSGDEGFSPVNAHLPAPDDFASLPFDVSTPTVSDTQPLLPDVPLEDKGDRIASEEYLPEALPAQAVENGIPEASPAIEETSSEERPARRPRMHRRYAIQEVIHKRQILLVQVVKEERGNKGAALTTYLSLPGRYCVLMPNTPRGGGISRKITNVEDRKRLKDMMDSLGVPEGMAVILRTAGTERPEADIRRDLDYLMKLWDTIREETLQSVAPKLIYEEANLVKRAIRDLYTTDIDDIHIEGDDAYAEARDLMKILMPSHVRKVHHYKSGGLPLFYRYQVEKQIDGIHSPSVQLRSGGYIVINQTEALVAIDVNSGRATRERNIEETALRTNLEAADEIARQVRLRDLAGLIVIDFIDMEENRHNMAVERRLKEAMKNDRARIQIGRISMFGLLELSRQRLRPSLAETHSEQCPHCGGAGVLRSAESAALGALRAVEEEGVRRRSSQVTLMVPTRVALYILNQKRSLVVEMEQRYGLHILVQTDDTLIAPDYKLERVRAAANQGDDEGETPVTADQVFFPEPIEKTEEPSREIERVENATPAAFEQRDRSQRRRGGNGRRRRPDRERSDDMPSAPVAVEGVETKGLEALPSSTLETSFHGDDHQGRRRRGRRGGRRRQDRPDYNAPAEDFSSPVPAAAPLPALSPTMSIDELFEASERAYEQKATSSAPPVSPGNESEQSRRPPRRGRGQRRFPGPERQPKSFGPEVPSMPMPQPSSTENAAGSGSQSDTSPASDEPQSPRRGWWNRLINKE